MLMQVGVSLTTESLILEAMYEKQFEDFKSFQHISLSTLSAALTKTHLLDTQIKTICSAWESHMRPERQWCLLEIVFQIRSYMLRFDTSSEPSILSPTMVSSIWLAYTPSSASLN